MIATLGRWLRRAGAWVVDGLATNNGWVWSYGDPFAPAELPAVPARRS